jgi:hypothetical protein
MRLLFRSDNDEYGCTKDLDNNDLIPPYAILSHTWEDDQEVTFQDLMDRTGKSKNGFNKIRFCGQQAELHGLQYFWVDTCCIDKSKKGEEQKAINSMFRFYRNATRCYVYLSDVSATKRKASDRLAESTWELAFRASRWFTRGWTLQELLAPRLVEFFSREGKRLGDNCSLKQQIHEITGVPKLALQGTRLSQFSDKVRFSWIQYRQTKVEEDKAYSLLGIFGVEMPLRYGEGFTNAFKRLEKEIKKMNKSLRDLRSTDPRDDKKRIEGAKGGLLENSYRWILDNLNFMRWLNDQHHQLLWIKGDPGKGKTMLLCGIINELNKSITKTHLLSYFFFQATDLRINNATAALRGLVYMLVIQQPSLISHVREKHEHAGKTLFEDANAWVALSEIFTNILQDPTLNSTYLIIDALDECVTDLDKFLRLIIEIMPTSPGVKWVISSRNNLDIEAQLSLYNEQRLSLELNAKQVSQAVEIFINHKVSQLTKIKDNSTLQKQVRNQVRGKANGTFLWVALVLQELERVETWDILEVLKEIPAGLQQLYDRMMRQIQHLKYSSATFCRLILSTTILAFRPLHLLELGILSGLPEEVSNNLDGITKIIGLCSSFLTVREGIIYFVHQSAKDYLLTNVEAVNKIFPSEIRDAHYVIFSRSLKAMSQTLQQDIYNLRLPGISIDLAQAQAPDPNPLASLQYSCIYWASHFQEAYGLRYQSDLTDNGEIYQFLQDKFLFWLEALSLIREIPRGVLTIQFLESCIIVS